MKVFRPIKSSHKTQAFGENKACRHLRTGKVITKVGICSGDYVDFYKAMGMKGHNGDDWSTWHGEPLFFPVDLNTKWKASNETDRAGGIGVDIISTEKVTLGNRTDYIKFRFWHLERSLVKDGEEVRFGQLIGRCDNTGASSGSHLHWSSKWCTLDGRRLDSSNGFYGAFDFTPWFENYFALDVLQVKQQALTAIQLATKVLFNVQQYIKKLSTGRV